MHLKTYIWISLFTALSLSAADKSHTITFSAYALKPVDTQELYYADSPESLTRLALRKKSRSILYTARLASNQSELKVFRKRIDADGQSFHELVGKVHVEPTKSQLLLLLTQANEAADTSLNLQTVDDSEEHFPLSSLRLVNLAGLDIFGEVGQSRVILENGDISQALRDGNKESLDISIAAEGKNRYHLLYKNTIRITSGSRGLLILTPPVRKGSVRIGGHLLLGAPSETKE